MTIRENRDYIRVLLHSYYTTITGWGVLLGYRFRRNPSIRVGFRVQGNRLRIRVPFFLMFSVNGSQNKKGKSVLLVPSHGFRRFRDCIGINWWSLRTT